MAEQLWHRNCFIIHTISYYVTADGKVTLSSGALQQQITCNGLDSMSFNNKYFLELIQDRNYFPLKLFTGKNRLYQLNY